MNIHILDPTTNNWIIGTKFERAYSNLTILVYCISIGLLNGRCLSFSLRVYLCFSLIETLQRWCMQLTQTYCLALARGPDSMSTDMAK